MADHDRADHIPAYGNARRGTSTAAADPTHHRCLVVTADPLLRDDLLRLAAAGCADVDVVPSPQEARHVWPRAPLVVVGNDVAADCLHARLPRRAGVVLVAGAGVEAAPAWDQVWQLAADLGADHVLSLPAAEAWLVNRFTDVSSGPQSSGRVIAVVGGRGGAGASVLATALAVTAARAGTRPLLVDADPFGGGLDLVLGWEETGGLRWPELREACGRVSTPALYDALPHVGHLAILSWDRGASLDVPVTAMEATLEAGRRGSDVVVIDLPRRLDAGVVHALQIAERVLLVVPAEFRACAAASRVAAAFGPHCASLDVVVRGPAPARLQPDDIAKSLALPLAGTLRPEPGLAAALERGEAPAGRGRGPLARLSRRILADLPTASDMREAA